MRSRTIVMLAVGAVVAGCAAVQQVAALRQVSFALGGVSGGRIAGVPLDRVASYRDLGVTDVARLGLAVARNELPFEFVLQVRAINPADNRSAARMVQMGWTLFLNDRETIRGVLDSSQLLPPGDTVTIPVRMQLDLMKYFEGGAEELVDFAASLAGVRPDPARIALEVIPRIDTPLGPITYPVPIRATVPSR